MISNTYIQFISSYSKQYTPIDIKIDINRYDEINNQLINHPSSLEKKEITSAIYTLFYTAINLNKDVKDLNSDDQNISYMILLADYIYSYCTETLYNKKEFSLLQTFTSITKKVIIDILNNRDTSYFLDALINNIE